MAVAALAAVVVALVEAEEEAVGVAAADDDKNWERIIDIDIVNYKFRWRKK